MQLRVRNVLHRIVHFTYLPYLALRMYVCVYHLTSDIWHLWGGYIDLLLLLYLGTF